MADGILLPSPGVYEHWKGGVYRLLLLASDEATGAPVAVYVCVSDKLGRCWTRPADSWFEEVDAPAGKRSRFRPLGVL